MTDISITAASVLAGTGAQTATGISGATLTAGKAVYLDNTTKTWKLADANGTGELLVPEGITLNGASAGQPVSVHLKGPITIGATLTAGTAYYLSDTPGGICPLADVGSGENVVLIGIAASTTVLNVDIQAPGVTL